MSIDWNALGAVGELLGAVLLIASVIYLAKQIRSNTDQTTAEAEREVQRDFMHIQELLATHSETLLVFRKGLASFNKLSSSDKAVFHFTISLFVNHFEGVLRMNSKGFLSSDVVETQGNIVMMLIASAGCREFWQLAGDTFSELSTAYISKRLSTGGEWGNIIDVFPYFAEIDA